MVTVDLASVYTPHPGQAHIHSDPARMKVLKVGRRWGKSRAALFDLLKTYVESLDVAVDSDLVPPFHAWIVGPSFPQCRQVWNEIVSFVPSDLIQPGGIRQDEMMVYLKGTEKRPWGLIEVKSAHNPDSLQTAGVDYLWITEAQDVADKAFEKCLPILRSPGRISKAMFEGIPALWSDHWFERVYRSVETGLLPDAMAYTASSFDNPFLTDDDRDAIYSDKNILPEAAWNRMYMAVFDENAGYFRNINACTAGDLIDGPIPGVTYVAGLDLGRKVDASVMTILDARDRKVVQHIAWDAGESWPLQREGVLKHAERWNLNRIVVDATGMGGDMFSQELMEVGLPVEPYVINENNRAWLLDALAISLERETIHFPDIPGLLRQLRAFQYNKMPGGSIKLAAPIGEHDDEVFALALGLTACDEAISAFTSPRMYNQRRRYVPTQAEADSGLNTSGHRILAERRARHAAERLERAGII